jgi:DDE family transposase
MRAYFHLPYRQTQGVVIANYETYLIRKGYLKIHIAVDIKKKRILSLEVTSEEVHDGGMLKNLIDNASENNNLKGIVADGMYDSNNNFRYLSMKDIGPGIKTRSNSKVRSTNCYARNMSVIKQQTNPKDGSVV